MKQHLLMPNWPAPSNVGAAVTLRSGGISGAPYSSNNLALHVGDCEATVLANRQTLVCDLNLPSDPLWLEQVHGTGIIYTPNATGVPRADASYTDTTHSVCAVLTADCLPVLLCNRSGTQVAAIHAGWRGLCNGIVRNTVQTFNEDKDQVMAYLGPAIGPEAFEVGAEVLQAFNKKAHSDKHKQAIEKGFVPGFGEGKYMADIYALARAELEACGVVHTYGGEHCTYSQPEQFYSYRRDPTTGRNGSLIWLKSHNK